MMADITSVVVGELAGLGNSEKSGANRGQTKQMSGTWLCASDARNFKSHTLEKKLDNS